MKRISLDNSIYASAYFYLFGMLKKWAHLIADRTWRDILLDKQPWAEQTLDHKYLKDKILLYLKICLLSLKSLMGTQTKLNRYYINYLFNS